MAFGGFGKGSGPTVPPKSQPAFGLNNPNPLLLSPSSTSQPSFPSYSNSSIDNHGHFPLQSQSPPFVPGNYQSVRGFQGHSISVQQPALGPRTLDSQAIPSANYANFLDPQLQPSVSPYIGSLNPQHSFTKEPNGQVSKRTRSPPSPFANRQENSNVDRQDFRRFKP